MQTPHAVWATVAVFVVIVIGALIVQYLDEQTKQECIKAGYRWIGGNCIER